LRIVFFVFAEKACSLIAVEIFLEVLQNAIKHY